MVEKDRTDSIDLDNGLTIEIRTCDFRTVRGYSIVATICDEIAFWKSEHSANPDYEVITALRPGMLTIPTSMLLMLSSPYSKRGVLWNRFKNHFGKERENRLVVKAPTTTMNLAITPEQIEKEIAEDPRVNRAEYEAEFRSDIERLIPEEVLLSCIKKDLSVRPYQKGLRYTAFVDPSGGRDDSFAMAIAHQEGNRAVLDLAVETAPPFSPQHVCQHYAKILREYHLGTVFGDHYGGDWPVEQFRLNGIAYKPSDMNKSSLYQEIVPLMNSGVVDLLDKERIIKQFLDLEAKTSVTGRMTITHPPGIHDDVANAVAGAIVHCRKKRKAQLVW